MTREYNRALGLARSSPWILILSCLADLQFAFTIIFHIIFPSFTIGLSAYIATLGVLWLRSGSERYQHAHALLDQDLRGLVRDGRRVRNRAVLSVRHQLEPLLGRGRQRGRSVDRLRGAERVFPGGDLPRRAAVRLQPRAALALRAVGSDRRRRHRHLGVLDSVGQQLDADADRLRTARRRRLSDRLARDHLQSEFPLSLRAHAQRRLPHHRLRRARGRRALSGRRPTRRGRPHHAAHGDRPDRHPGAAAIGAWRSARPQHARASADQDRCDGSALGWQQARRLPHLRLAGRKGGREQVSDFHPERRVAHPHASHERPVPGIEQRAGVPTAAGEDRVFRVPHHARHRLLHDRRCIVRRVPVVARHVVRDALVLARHGAMLVGRLRRGDCRLGGDRNRAPALDRSRHPAHRRRHVAGAGRDHRRYTRAVRHRLRRRVLVRHLLHQPPDRPRPDGAGSRRDRAIFGKSDLRRA